MHSHDAGACASEDDPPERSVDESQETSPLGPGRRRRGGCFLHEALFKVASVIKGLGTGRCLAGDGSQLMRDRAAEVDWRDSDWSWRGRWILGDFVNVEGGRRCLNIVCAMVPLDHRSVRSLESKKFLVSALFEDLSGAHDDDLVRRSHG